MFPGVSLVDVGRTVFDVDDPLVNQRQQAFHMVVVDMEARLDVEMLAMVHHLMKLLDEQTAQTGLSTPESDAAPRGEEIEVVNADVVQ